MSANGKKHKNDLVLRGFKEPTPLGTGLFLGLRSLDPFLQYGILARGVGAGLLAKTGVKTLAQGPPFITGTILDRLSLSPYRLILLSMAVGSVLKQNYWVVSLSQEGFPPSSALIVSAFNTVCNSLNSFLFVSSLTSASVNGEHFPQTPLIVGSALYVVGILTETLSEWQRVRFKRKPGSKGKVYDGGLFGLARHINYGGYVLWRAGYALACGGWIWGAIVGSFFTYNFIAEGIPELDLYCNERYGDQWQRYREKTPYKLFPFIL